MNPEDCRNHTLNTSGTKHAYKFGKSERFKAPRLHTHSIYTPHDIKTVKACGFGFGDRHSVVNKNNNTNPSPQAYQLPSTLSLINKSKTFGSSREDTKFQSFLLKALKQASTPSPLSYYVPSRLHQRKFSLGARLPTEIDIKTNKKNRVPSPGAYHLQKSGEAVNGKFASSKHKNIQKIIFFGRDDGLQQKHFQNGPGSYNISPSLDESTYRKTCKSFGTACRPEPADASKKYNPGPGMYETFSQFPSYYQQQ